MIRTTTRRIALSTLALVIGSGAVAACGSSDPEPSGGPSAAVTEASAPPTAEESQPAQATPAATGLAGVGDCVARSRADSDGTVPDLATPVPCTEPHLFEITEIVDLPEVALSGTTDEEKLAHRSSLVRDDASTSPAHAAFEAFAEPVCQSAIQRVVGYDTIELGGVTATDLQIGSISARTAPAWRTLSTPEDWLAGNEQLVCSTRFVDAAGTTGAPQTSPTDAPLMSTFLTPAFPEELRQCLTYVGETASVTDCTEAHYGEIFASFNAKPVLGEDFVEGLDPATYTGAQQARLSKACLELAAGFLAPDFDTAVLAAQGDLGGTVGWGTDDAAYYPVQCMITAKDSRNQDLPAGSLVGSDGKDVQLVAVS